MNFLQKQNFLRALTLQEQPSSLRQQKWTDECNWRKDKPYFQWHPSANLVQHGDFQQVM